MSQGAKAPTLSGVSFYLSEGEVLGVIGKSGSGKSTLAKTILGLTHVVAGEVRFGGATLDQYGPDALGAYIGYLPQNVVLFSGTIAENIARMSTTPDDEKIVEAAKRANAHEMILSLPDGYKTLILSEDSQLSGGQKQRIALARALYGDPVFLVLDEPNSALDNDGSIALNLAVREFKATNRSVVILTHRPSAISECDRLLVIERGAHQGRRAARRGFEIDGEQCARHSARAVKGIAVMSADPGQKRKWKATGPLLVGGLALFVLVGRSGFLER